MEEFDQELVDRPRASVVPDQSLGGHGVDGIRPFSTFIEAGAFLGVSIGCSLTQLEARIPLDFAENLVGRRGKLLFRDYGLVEFTFERRDGWQCTGATAQLHRLASSTVEYRFDTDVSVNVITESERVGGRLDAGDVWSLSLYMRQP